MGLELFAALAQDWQVVASSPEADAALHRWRTDPVLGHFHSAGEILERTALGAERVTSDSVLGALLHRAPRDEFAARVALQVLSPGLLTVARRMGAARDPDVAAEVVAAGLARIKCYPCERRPQGFAANVILDVLNAVHRGRSSAGREMATPPEMFHWVAEPEASKPARPDAREVLEVAASSGRLPEGQVQLVFDAVLDQVPVSAAAARAGISVKAMTRRRDRAKASVVRAYRAARSTDVEAGPPPVTESTRDSQRRPHADRDIALARDFGW
jgi:DNA-directed RNA polymerase specialized sigma24 family protein